MNKKLFRYLGSKVDRNSMWFNITHAMIQIFSILKSTKANFDNLDAVFNSKKSETLVLVGGGKSLNEISIEQFQYLNNFDTLAVSYGILAPLNFDYFVNEHPEEGQEENQRKIFSELQKRKRNNQFLSTKVIWKSPGLYTDNLTILNEFKVFHVPSIIIKAHSTKAQKKFLSFAKQLGLLQKFLFQPAGTVSAIIIAAREFGYNRVITVGIDVENREYFFIENNNYSHLNLEDPFLSDRRKETLHNYHPTVQENGTPENYVKIIKEIAGKKLIVQPTSTNSALKMEFEVFKFPIILDPANKLEQF